MKKYLYIFCILQLCSCSSINKKNCIIEENNIEKTNSVRITTNEALYVDKVFADDSLLYLINRKTDSFLYVYNKFDFSFKCCFGNLGQGPDDFQFPFFLESKQIQKNVLKLYDVNLVSFKNIDIDKMQKKEKDAIISVSMPKYIIGSPNLYMTNDSIFIGNMDNSQGLFFTYNSIRNDLKWINFPKELIQPENDFSVMNMNRVAINEDENRIVSAMCYYNLFFLYDMNGTLKRTVQLGKEKIIPKIIDKQIISEDNLIISRDIASSNKYVFILVENVKEKDFENLNNKHSKIIVLDWDLNYIKTYKLPHYAISVYFDKFAERIIYTTLNSEGGTDLYYIPTRL
ncbi:hypothetical protein [Phocaeicola paurosaccharolyticus]|jgi:hypothetical protein|uniref:hypothetical protein n=1 Tax=Phocaeicola paurosaccharolyticus TaxID=732242 RepID=UPI0011DE199D|nr:hypothetical protein [Phocaeicola paurosaccharolyticus]